MLPPRPACEISATAEPLLAEMADELPAAVAVFGRDGSVQYANPALADSFGVPPGSLTGRDLDYSGRGPTAGHAAPYDDWASHPPRAQRHPRPSRGRPESRHHGDEQLGRRRARLAEEDVDVGGDLFPTWCCVGTVEADLAKSTFNPPLNDRAANGSDSALAGHDSTVMVSVTPDLTLIACALGYCRGLSNRNAGHTAPR
jgi:PAS fold